MRIPRDVGKLVYHHESLYFLAGPLVSHCSGAGSSEDLPSCHHFRIGHPWLFTLGILQGVFAHFFLLNTVSAATTASHIKTSQKR